MGVLKLRPSVKRFAQDMERALRKHDRYRGFRGWQHDTSFDLFQRLNEEAKELEDMICESERPDRKTRLRKEAADVGNFAMMIHDVNR